MEQLGSSSQTQRKWFMLKHLSLFFKSNHLPVLTLISITRPLVSFPETRILWADIFHSAGTSGSNILPHINACYYYYNSTNPTQRQIMFSRVRQSSELWFWFSRLVSSFVSARLLQISSASLFLCYSEKMIHSEHISDSVFFPLLHRLIHGWAGRGRGSSFSLFFCSDLVASSFRRCLQTLVRLMYPDT